MMLAELGGLSKSIVGIFMFINLFLSYKSFMIEILSELFLVKKTFENIYHDEKEELNDLKTIIETNKINET